MNVTDVVFVKAMTMNKIIKSSESKLAYMKEYNSRPEVLERARIRNRRPDVMVKRLAYSRTDKALEKRRKYEKTPERMESCKKRARLLRKTPGYKEYIKLLSKKNRYTPTTKFSVYRAGAIRRGLSFKINMEQFMELWKKPCAYCGAEIKTIGIDRVDNSIGYTKSNIVSCCYACNWSKHNGSEEEYIARCRMVVQMQTRNVKFVAKNMCKR